MKKAKKIALIIVIICVLLFAASLAVYFFNLDMRFVAKLQTRLEALYDRVKRTPMP